MTGLVVTIRSPKIGCLVTLPTRQTFRVPG